MGRGAARIHALGLKRAAAIRSAAQRVVRTLRREQRSSPLNTVSLGDPIRSEIVWNVESLHIREAEIEQLLKRGAEVWTAIPRAASAVDDDRFVFRQRGHSLTKQLLAFRLPAGAR